LKAQLTAKETVLATLAALHIIMFVDQQNLCWLLMKLLLKLGLNIAISQVSCEFLLWLHF